MRAAWRWLKQPASITLSRRSWLVCLLALLFAPGLGRLTTWLLAPVFRSTALTIAYFAAVVACGLAAWLTARARNRRHNSQH